MSAGLFFVVLIFSGGGKQLFAYMMLLILYTLSSHISLSSHTSLAIFLSLSVGETGVSVCIRVHMLISMCSHKLVYLRVIFMGNVVEEMT